MKTKTGVIRIVEVQEGGKWKSWCMCFKYELSFMIRSYSAQGGIATKCRWRLAGSDKWHVDFIADYV